MAAEPAFISRAERVNTLFKTWRKKGAPEQSNAAVAAALTAAGVLVDEATISALRSDDAVGADELVLASLAAHFSVPPEYLTAADHHDVHTELVFLARMIDAGVRNIQLRGKPTAQNRLDLTHALARRRADPVLSPEG